ncbi:hypothetical protein B0H66DRAFT_321595 [Apodospora peruviana]|uniref:Protamine P1 n=1 Tax=Apodospora peruviana TaxID=516989 RepID=A0AAE0HXN5_9PEZI|nr:hypothetical protein B0H66DRAFT_321595 [Apodospora peruviana]
MKRSFAPSQHDLLQHEQFGNQPVYFETPHNHDDVLYSGSDDETYSNATERRRRIEHKANRFLEGRPMFLASVVLRGPFDQKSGWRNPWRSRSHETSRRPQRPKILATNIGVTTVVEENTESNPPPSPRPSGYPSPQRTDTPPPADEHDFLDHPTFSRIRDWREQVVIEVGVDIAPTASACQQEATSTQNSRLSERVSKRLSSSSVSAVYDPIDTSVIPDVFSPESRSVHAQVESGATEVSESRPRQHRITIGMPVSNQTGKSDRTPDGEPTTQDWMHQEDPDPVPSRISSSGKPVSPAKQLTPEKILERETRQSDEKVIASQQSLTDCSFRFRTKAPRLGWFPTRSTTGSSKSRLEGQPERVTSQENIRNDKVPYTGSSKPQVTTPGVIISIQRNLKSNWVASTSFAASLERRQSSSVVQAPHIHGSQFALESIAAGNEPQSSETDGGNQGFAEDEGINGGHTEHENTEIASPIDGPTLVASTVSTDSELSDVSMGNFSAEKQSQNLLHEMIPMPGRLLWPKAQRDVTDTTDTSRESDSSRLLVVKNQDLPLEVEQAELSDENNEQIEITLQQAEQTGLLDEVEEHSGAVQISTICRVIQKDDQPSGSRSKETKIPEKANNGEDNDIRVGTPTRAPTEQSPSRNTQIKVRSSKSDGTTKPFPGQSTNSQSPWGKEGLHDVEQSSAKLSFIASQALDQAVFQSPWAKGDSQIATVQEPREFNALSSPLQEIATPNLVPIDLPHSGEDMEMSDNNPSRLLIPSTPDVHQSSLLTPDYTLSTKSSKDSMIPSPQLRPAKRPRLSATDGRLPSTQILMNAAVSNPWQHSPQPSKKKRKRVSWANLSSEGSYNTPDGDGDSSSATAKPEEEGPAQKRRVTGGITRRAASPPLVYIPTKLPGEQEKFAKHFAAMTSRRRHVSTLKRRSIALLLPSASQQACSSPGFEAMAERFRAADAVTDCQRDEQPVDLTSHDGAGETPTSSSAHGMLQTQLQPELHEQSSSKDSKLDPSSEISNDDDSIFGEMDESLPSEQLFLEEEEEQTPPPPPPPAEEEVDIVQDFLKDIDSVFDNPWEITGDSTIESAFGGDSGRRSSGFGGRRSGGILMNSNARDLHA